MPDWALDLRDVRAGYGETVVIEDIRFALGPSETVSVIGRNGVGKTTLLATIMGHTTLHGGQLALHGNDISTLATYRRVTAGLGYVPQEREIFPSLTLRENLEVAARPGPWTVDTVFELFPRLAERASNMGNQLSGGEQQMLAIGRALIGNPTVLLMDEPSEGLEAKSSFGDDRVFIEKYVEEPRHIEIQVLGDKHGNVIHLNERECSIQRRNQKVVEEAPSPFLDAKTRAAMGSEAVALAKAVGYDSAGTVEFIVDKDRNFYFLEMNTRLQVEHPVTELVTGLDLVEEMLKVAAGEKLALKQKDVKLKGSAIETRIYAEDPERNFLPSTGRLVRYRPPKLGVEGGVTTRLDSGVEEGGEISVYYDPMIAKLVTHAPKRAQAIEQMGSALDAFAIDGFRHNIPFLAVLMRNERWKEGRLSTKFIAEEFPDGFSPPRPQGKIRDVLVAVAASIDHLSNQRRRAITQQMHGEKVRFAETRMVELGDERVRVTVAGGLDGPVTVTLGGNNARGKPKRIELASSWWFGEPVWEGTVDGVATAVQVRPILNGMKLTYQGVEAETRVFTERETELMATMPEKVKPDMSKFLLCPMPGLMVSLAVCEGQEVAAGDALCVVEAMKMENVLKAELDAKVSKIFGQARRQPQCRRRDP